MPETMNGTQVPQYAGSAFHICPPASALPVPKTFPRPSSGSGVRFSPSRKQEYSLDAITDVLQGQRDAEGPSDGDEASAVALDKSHEGKSAVSELVSETKKQDRPVDDVKPEATFTTSHAVSIAFEKPITRINDDEVNGLENRQPVSENDDLHRRQQAIIDQFEAQTTPQATIPPQRCTIPANVLRSAQTMQQNWIEQRIRSTGQLAAAWLAAYRQSTDEMLRVCKRRLERNLAGQEKLKRLLDRLDEIDEEIERGRSLAEDDEEGPGRRTGDGNGNSNGNGDDGNGVAGIQGGSGDGEEAEEAVDLVEAGGIDDEYSCAKL